MDGQSKWAYNDNEKYCRRPAFIPIKSSSDSVENVQGKGLAKAFRRTSLSNVAGMAENGTSMYGTARASCTEASSRTSLFGNIVRTADIDITD